MALNPALVYMSPFQIQLWDKDLDVPLAAGVVNFYQDINHSIPKDVYQLVGSGSGGYSYVNLGSSLTLSGIGTFVDGSGNNLQVYLYPYLGFPTDEVPSGVVDLYYITVTSAQGVPQESINAWPPNVTGEVGPANVFGTTNNILSNPQFVNVNFANSAISAGTAVSFSTAGTNIATDIAPDWSMITTGNGSFSIYQYPVTGSSAPTNPPYALGIASSSGYSSPLLLRQRLFTPSILANTYVSGTFLVSSQDGSVYNMTMSYVPSVTGTAEVVCTGNTLTTGWTSFSGTVEITPGNTGTVPGSYIDITISIPVGAQVLITSVQLCGVGDSEEAVAFLEQTPAQQVNGLFHYYQPKLNFKPLPSWLVGWDFALNPTQFNGPSGGPLSLSGTNRALYIWDQTICFQSVDSSIIFSQNSNTLGLTLSTANTTSFALIQYLPIEAARDILNERMAVALNAFVSTGSGTIKGTISLLFTTATNVQTLPSSCLISVDNNGVPALNTAWDYVPNALLGNSVAFITPNATTSMQAFSGWDARAIGAINSATFFAIVISFAPITSSQAITVNYVSLNSGDIATRPAPQTVDEVLRECQYYWRSSFAPGVTPMNNTGLTSGPTYSIQWVAGSGDINVIPIRFLTPMRVKPVYPPTYYNPTSGPAGQILNVTTGASYTGTSSYSSATLSQNGFVVQGQADAGSSAGNLLALNWSVDARIGIV